MKRVARLLLGVVIGMAVLAGGARALIQLLGSHEAQFRGKPLWYWCEQLTNKETAGDVLVQGVVTNEIIPALTREMFSATNDSKIRVTLIEQLNHLPGVEIPFVPAEGRRAAAALGLGNLGPAGRPAVSALLKALQSDDGAVRGPAAEALVQVKADPAILVPALLASLRRPVLEGRAEIVEALGEFGSRSKEAVPMLLQLSSERNDKDLMEAVRVALKKIDPEEAAKAGIK